MVSLRTEELKRSEGGQKENQAKRVYTVVPGVS